MLSIDDDASGARRDDAFTAETLKAIGKRIRTVRGAQGLTLQTLADSTGLSRSMLSLVERGRASPSLASLIAIARALGVALTHLIADGPDAHPVTRLGDQAVLETPQNVFRRVLRDDRRRGVLVTHNEYLAGAANAPQPITHIGYEFGLVVSGELTIDLDGERHILRAGDLIAHDSSLPHRIWNGAKRPARAFWFNLSRREGN